MYTLDRARIVSEIKRQGFGSIEALAKSLGVHRNSISGYLSGKAVFPKSVQHLLEALNLDPGSVLLHRTTPHKPDALFKDLAAIIDKLVVQFPGVGFLVFGSRAKNKARKYSDLDLGIIGPGPLNLDTWTNIREVVEAETENWPVLVDVVDLGRASEDFLKEVKKSCIFLGGTPLHWRWD